jgi:hypothetical protein
VAALSRVEPLVAQRSRVTAAGLLNSFLYWTKLPQPIVERCA